MTKYVKAKQDALRKREAAQQDKDQQKYRYNMDIETLSTLEDAITLFSDLVTAGLVFCITSPNFFLLVVLSF